MPTPDDRTVPRSKPVISLISWRSKVFRPLLVPLGRWFAADWNSRLVVPLECYAASTLIAARLGSLLVVACGASSCSPSAKTEAATLIGAVDRYRNASDEAKLDRARAVGSVRCSDSSVCKAKRACEDAVVPSARALAIKDQVSERVRDLREGRLAPDSPEAAALPEALHEAERLLAEGRAKMPECERLLIALRVALGV
jgi:hypothetical protein